MVWRNVWARRGSVSVGTPGAAWEALEPRKLMSVDLGWSTALDGFAIAYENLYPDHPDSVGVIRVTGTGGDDVMNVAEAPADSPSLRLRLNGAEYLLRLSDLSSGFHSIILDGAAGDDRISSDVTWEFAPAQDRSMWGVSLLGGAGNDHVTGGSCTHALRGGAGDDVIVSGDGRSFLTGDDGNDTLFGHGVAYDGNGLDPTYDQFDGGAGDDVVHGGAHGYAVADQGDDVVFDGFPAGAGEHLRVQNYDSPDPAPHTAGDPVLADAAATGAAAALVGDVLVLTGTDGDDAVTIQLTGGATGTVAVTVSGTTSTFPRSAVRRYAFDSRGGHDDLTLGSDGGRFDLRGWVLRTASPADGVSVHASDSEVEFDRTPNEPGAANVLITPEGRSARRQRLHAEHRAEVAARRAAHRANALARAEARARVKPDRATNRRDASEPRLVLLGWAAGTSPFGQVPIR